MSRRVSYVPSSDRPSRRGQKGAPQSKGGAKHRSDPKVKERAQELADGGMPYQLAMAVALGRVSLNEALERLARLERVERVMEQHELSRALATQVVLGHASLGTVLARRRLQEHRETYRDRSCVDDSKSAQRPLGLALHGQRHGVGTVVDTDLYTVTWRPEGSAEDEVIHKLQLKYAWMPDDFKKMRRALRTDKDLAQAPRDPIPKPQDRYTCSDKRLFRYLDREQPISVTLLEGEQFKGTVSWFSRYEFGLRLKDLEITVFRHCLHDIAEG
jgi:sRNA-binding regulator protein Hfq